MANIKVIRWYDAMLYATFLKYLNPFFVRHFFLSCQLRTDWHRHCGSGSIFIENYANIFFSWRFFNFNKCSVSTKKVTEDFVLDVAIVFIRLFSSLRCAIVPRMLAYCTTTGLSTHPRKPHAILKVHVVYVYSHFTDDSNESKWNQYGDRRCTFSFHFFCCSLFDTISIILLYYKIILCIHQGNERDACSNVCNMHAK